MRMEAINLFVKTQPQLKATIERIVENGIVRSKTLELDANEYLFHEGELVRSTFYVKRGLIKLSSDNADGRSKTVFLHKTGTLLGFQGFQDDEERKPSILNARASMRSTVIAIDSKDFGNYLREHGDVCHAMVQYMFSMLALETREAVNSSTYPVLQRFAALLLNLAYEFGATCEPAMLPFNNSDFAEMLGAHVNSINNAVASLRRSGCIDKQRGYLAIIDFNKLENIAENLV